VAFLDDLDPDRPQAFTLLGEDLVLWYNRGGHGWRAFADACPHRLVPLSQGRINEAGELECPYHGWSFNGTGTCTAIPQAQEEQTISPRSNCRPYATATGQGLLFVFSGPAAEADSQPLPLLPMLHLRDGCMEGRAGWADGWIVQDIVRDLPMDALTLLENVLDVSHVPFTHHATVGRRETAGPVNLQLTSFGPEGFTGLWPEGPRRGTLGSQHTTYAAPCLMWHDLTAPRFARILTVVYATPIRRGECRLFARFPFQFRSPWPARLLALRPRWLQHLGNHTVLEDDQIFLHWQERLLEQRGGSHGAIRSFHLPTSADRYIRALHGAGSTDGPPGSPHPPLPQLLGSATAARGARTPMGAVAAGGPGGPGLVRQQRSGRSRHRGSAAHSGGSGRPLAVWELDRAAAAWQRPTTAQPAQEGPPRGRSARPLRTARALRSRIRPALTSVIALATIRGPSAVSRP